MEAPKTMKAWRLAKYGEPQDAIDSLRLEEDVAVPAVQPGQVLIKVAYASLNPIDWKLFTGAMRGAFPIQMPYTPGFDASGVVVAANQCKRLEVGAEVCVYTGLVESCRAGSTFGPAGAFAEYCVAPEDAVALCGQVPLDIAAALPLAGVTAFQALFTGGQRGRALGSVGQGSKVLVLGGATAVGVHAIQLAVASGAQVFTTASANPMPDGSSKIDFCAKLGATVFNYKETDWSKELDGQDLELIFDCSGDNGDWQKSPAVLRKDGRFLTVANLAAHPRELDGRECEAFVVHAALRDLETLLGRVADGRHQVPIDSVGSFAELQDLLTKSVKGTAAGKLLVKIA